MDFDYTFDIEEINCYHHKNKLCIGFIVECKFGLDYGIIYQFNDESYSTECKKGALYFFLKEKNIEIPQNTLVSFIKDLHNSWNKLFEVSNVCRLEDFENYILTSSEEIKSYNKTSSTKKMRNLMCAGKKFLVAHYNERQRDLTCRLYYPIINEAHKTIYYYFFTASSFTGPNTVFECYTFILATKDFVEYSHINKNIKQFLGYLDALNSDSVLELYSVYDKGYFQSRPGRDDHYIYTKDKVCSSIDPYLHQLTELGSVVTDYYNCLGRDADDFSSLNIEDTNALRDTIKQKYNSSEHLLFLMSFYLESVNSLKEDINKAIYSLPNFIKKGDEYIFTKSFLNLEQWKEFILSYNKFW